MTDRTYHIIVEGYLTTNMTMKNIRENVHVNVWGWSIEKQKVTVKRIVEKAKEKQK